MLLLSVSGVEASRAPNALIELRVKVDVGGIGSLSDQSRHASMIISYGSTVASPWRFVLLGGLLVFIGRGAR